MDPELYAHELYALSDSDLDGYLQRNYNLILVKDTKNLDLSPAFKARLSARNNSPAFVNPTRSFPAAETVDGSLHKVEQVLRASKLPRFNFPTAYRVSTSLLKPVKRSDPHRSPPSLYAFNSDRDNLWRAEWGVQTRAYNKLVSLGGTPSYPHWLMPQIIHHPGQYRLILEYWQLEGYRDGWATFPTQLCHWKGFQSFQAFVRDKEAPANQRVEIQHVEMTWDNIFGHNIIYPGTYISRKPRAFPSGSDRFETYTSWANDVLKGHGVDRVIEFLEDHTAQSRLSTLQEYLVYVGFWSDWYMVAAIQMAPKNEGIAREKDLFLVICQFVLKETTIAFGDLANEIDFDCELKSTQGQIMELRLELDTPSAKLVKFRDHFKQYWLFSEVFFEHTYWGGKG